jgi:hypothetical protein
MESAAYLINRHFVLIAVDTNYQYKLGDTVLKIPNAKKVYKLNDTNLVSVIGNPFKTTNIYKYLLKLNEYGHNKSFEEIVEDLNDVFNATGTDLIDNLKSLASILPNFYNETGHLKIDEIANSLKDRPELLSVLSDGINILNDSTNALTQVVVFGWNRKSSKMDAAHLVALGNHLHGNQAFQLAEGFIHIKFSASSMDISKKTHQLEAEAIQKFKRFITPGWDLEPTAIEQVLELGKDILTDGLKQISPYEGDPNVIFYELSERTNNIFIEPDLHLTKIEFNNKR